MAYQIGFDLYESGTQDLLSHIRQGLRKTAPVPHLLKDFSAASSSTTSSTEVAKPKESETSEIKDEDAEMEDLENKEKEEESKDQPMKEDKKLDDLVIIMFLRLYGLYFKFLWNKCFVLEKFNSTYAVRKYAKEMIRLLNF